MIVQTTDSNSGNSRQVVKVKNDAATTSTVGTPRPPSPTNVTAVCNLLGPSDSFDTLRVASGVLRQSFGSYGTWIGEWHACRDGAIGGSLHIPGNRKTRRASKSCSRTVTPGVAGWMQFALKEVCATACCAPEFLLHARTANIQDYVYGNAWPLRLPLSPS